MLILAVTVVALAAGRFIHTQWCLRIDPVVVSEGLEAPRHDVEVVWVVAEVLELAKRAIVGLEGAFARG